MKTKFLQYTSNDEVIFDEPVTLNSGLKGVAANTILNETLKAGESKTVSIGSHGTYIVTLRWSGTNSLGTRVYLFYSYYNHRDAVKLADLINFYAGNNVHELTFGDGSITLSVTNTYDSNGNNFVLTILKLA